MGWPDSGGRLNEEGGLVGDLGSGVVMDEVKILFGDDL